MMGPEVLVRLQDFLIRRRPEKPVVIALSNTRTACHDAIPLVAHENTRLRVPATETTSRLIRPHQIR